MLRSKGTLHDDDDTSGTSFLIRSRQWLFMELPYPDIVELVDFFHSIGKLLIILGIIFIAGGIVFTLAPKIPWLGKMPGDIVIQKRNVTFYFPIVTCIIISIIITILFSFFGRR